VISALGAAVFYPGQNGQHIYNKFATRGYPQINLPKLQQPLPQEPPPPLDPINTIPKWKLILQKFFEGVDSWSSDVLIIVNPCVMNPRLGCGPYGPLGPA
jgi:hypothetical protein